MYSQDIIETVYNRVSIENLIGRFLSLSKRGDQLVGLCPFDSSPHSLLVVYPTKGLYKCFECNNSGNVIDFVMAHEGVSQDSAVRYLVDLYNLDLDLSGSLQDEESSNIPVLDKLYEASEWASGYFHRALESEEGKAIGLSYIESREISTEAIDIFSIGYSPGGYGVMSKAAIESGMDIEPFVTVGLTIKKDQQVRDRFRDRVIFPIQNISGRVIGFGGRALRSDNPSKYLNSPESDLYHKRDILYGLYQAKEHIIANDSCFIAEGYTDVISLYMSGVKNVVSSSGTALTESQVRLLRRFTNNITMIYDGDSAGIAAAIKGVALILKAGMNAKIVPLPEGDDPDSFARARTEEELQLYIKENETDFINFAISIRLSDTDHDPIQKASVISEIVNLISLIPDKHARSRYINECSVMFRIDESKLYIELRRSIAKQLEEQSKRSAVLPEDIELSYSNNFVYEELELLKLLFKFWNLEMSDPSKEKDKTTVISYVLDQLDQDEYRSSDETIHKIIEIFRENQINYSFVPDIDLCRYQDKDVAKLSVSIVANQHNESRFWSSNGGYVVREEQMLLQIVEKTVDEYKWSRVNSSVESLLSELKEVQKGSIDTIMDIQDKLLRLKVLQKALSDRLGRRAILL